MKVAIFCGSRDVDKHHYGHQAARNLMSRYMRDSDPANPHVVIHGAARGADSMFATVARELGANVLEFPAQWNTHGKSAGILRNQQMLDELLKYGGEHEIFCIALVPTDLTRGTANMVSIASKAHIPTTIYSCDKGLLRAR